MEATATSGAHAPRLSYPSAFAATGSRPVLILLRLFIPRRPTPDLPPPPTPTPYQRHCRPTPRSRSGGHGPPPLHKYSPGEPLSIKVTSLTSIDIEIPYSYYSLPFCAPPEGVKDSAENLGELLMGDRIESSPYPFRMHTNESDVLLCRSPPLDAIAMEGLLAARPHGALTEQQP